jgi:hypothetical protein
MALRTETKTIGERTFEVSQLPYFRAQRLLTRLLKVAGHGVTGLLAIIGAGGGREALASVADMDTAQLGAAMAGFFDKLDPDEVDSISKEILATARVRYDGKLVALLDVIDVVMGGDFWGVMALQAFALSVHFGNFSSARDALAGALGQTTASRSSASTTSTGSPASS